MQIGILTSSRADYGIYTPLLKAIEKDPSLELKIIVFGTHLSKHHGYTLSQIEADGFKTFAKIESMMLGDSPNAIASSFALTALKFGEFWKNHHSEFNVVFALGDRFEMAAAVAASIPFGVKIAHLFGGETTLGAIDNIYRHFISHASYFHFVSTKLYADRLENMLDAPDKLIYNVGSLSLENIEKLPLLNIHEFHEKWDIDLTLPTILVTAHPETVNLEKNETNCASLCKSLEVLSTDFQIVITMPNADTHGMIFRQMFQKLALQNSAIKIIENFGSQSYFTCMKYARLMIGNTSSGIVEAASFKKYVLNLGDRQKGRFTGENVIHLEFDTQTIVSKAMEYGNLEFSGANPYHQPKPSAKILETIKKYYGSLS